MQVPGNWLITMPQTDRAYPNPSSLMIRLSALSLGVLLLMRGVALGQAPATPPVEKPAQAQQTLPAKPSAPEQPTTPVLKKTIEKTVIKSPPMPQIPDKVVIPTLEALRFNEIVAIKDPTLKLSKLAAFERMFPNSMYQKYVDELTINARWDRYLEAQQEHLYDEAYPLGELLLPNMTGTPQELLVLVSQAKMAGYEAFDGDPQWLESGADYAHQAIDLLGKGEQLDSDPSRWMRQQPLLMGQMYRTIGLAHANKGEWAEAEESYRKVLTYDCGDPTIYFLMGQMSDTHYQSVAAAYNKLPDKTAAQAKDQFAQARVLARQTLDYYAQAYQAAKAHRNAPSFIRLRDTSLGKMKQLQPIAFYIEPKLVKDKKGRTQLAKQRQPGFDSYLQAMPPICPKQPDPEQAEK